MEHQAQAKAPTQQGCKAKLGVEVIAMGDIFRAQVKENSELGKKVKSYVEKGALVPDEIVVEVLKAHLAKIPKGNRRDFGRFSTNT